jgi:hypothetical protein
MTFLALIAIIFFGFAVYNLTCAFVDIPTKKTSQMMMLSRKQQGTKNEKLLDVYVTKIAGWIAPCGWTGSSAIRYNALWTLQVCSLPQRSIRPEPG